MVYEDRPWLKSYDEGIPYDIDPSNFETTFVKLLKPAFTDYPNRLAMHFLGVDFTFKDLENYSNQISNMLIKNGLNSGDVVAINLANIPQYMIAHIGVLKAGCVSSGLSPLLSPEEMEYQLKDSSAKALFTIDAIFEQRLTKIIKNLPDLKVIIPTNIADFLPKIKQVLGKLLKKVPKGKVTKIPGKIVINFMDIVKGKNAYPNSPVEAELTPDSTCLLMYTGGTTGLPKGSVLTHRNICSNIIQMDTWLSLGHGNNVACSGFPFFHIAGLTTCAMCVYTGTSQILIPNPRDTKHICKEIKKFKPTMLVNVPTLYQMLMKDPEFKSLPFSQLHTAISAAAPFPAESIRELEKYIGENKFLEVYGMTETSPLTTMNPTRGAKKIGSVGLPLPNTFIKLVDISTGEEVDIGEPGELCAKGPQIMKEYLNKPEQTQKTIDEEGYIHTGDVAKMDENGYFSIVDRTKDMIIVGGYKVFSTKLEDKLSEHPAVDLIATIGVPDKERPGSEIVKAYITLKPAYKDKDKELIKEEIIKFAKEKVAPYEVPKIIEIRDELPISNVGKILKKTLRDEIKKS